MIQEQWKEERCPIVDGIVFGDGRIVAIEQIKAVSTYWDEWYFPLFKPEQVVVDKF